ncbi:PucR family transcriptional regulator [Streptomyces avermitilis]|uniref:Regulatory protein n=2 Tax=Streptomyces avermitilis TaxID=33903 RepID=Q82A96_STRAW|nr:MULTISPECIES: helix-turn-helix domain-containing protein [Streptomyces]KUN54291.1 PucR family transcriptional regulator [Streptomyces avermitilis]MYT01717.1 PucR family transcriptional regulator [Streptomyces sp. SID5469]OOV28231.1 PucR family transcriptional regulator [Streptomyces avermitilis]BAC73874.1 putative regulatory protein [Streptomyces avermitilis MA-4680 = NBRC 14893]GDY66390.1 PucR family transcriptional regulator [Streptomyces avermitilis]
MPNAVRARVRAVPGLPPASPPVRSLVDAEAVAVLRRAAAVLMDDLPEITERLLAVLQEQEPAYRAAFETDPSGLWQEVHRSLRHNVGSLLRPRECRDAARRCSWRIGAERAEQGMPLDALLHAFRLGGALVWRRLVEEAARRDPDDVRLLVHVASDVWNFVDEHCTLVADAYRHVERQLAWRRENRLRLMTTALLDGTTRIADLPDVATALDLPEQGRYAVVSVAVAHPAGHVGTQLLSVPPGMRALWHTGTDVEHGIVHLGEREPKDLVDRVTVPIGARVGISRAVDGLAAVGDARRLAETALRACPESGGTVLLDEHLPAALLVSAPALGTALVNRVLGPLLSLDPSDRDLLLDTVSAWLDNDGSAQRAASRLYCHRNTVLNRLRRFEQLTGRCLTRPADVVDTSLALTARRLLGD